MTLTISSRKFTQKVGVAKRATNIEPVFKALAALQSEASQG